VFYFVGEVVCVVYDLVIDGDVGFDVDCVG